MQLSKELNVVLDPNERCSDAVIKALQYFLKANWQGTNRIEVAEEKYEEYGFFLPSTSDYLSPNQQTNLLLKCKLSDPRSVADNKEKENLSESSYRASTQADIWLESTQPLSYYQLHRKKETLEIRLKPKLVKVKFLDNTFQLLAFDPYMLVQEVLEEIGAKLALPAHVIPAYGLHLENEEFERQHEKAQNSHHKDKEKEKGKDGKKKAKPKWMNPKKELLYYNSEQMVSVTSTDILVKPTIS